MGVKNKTLLLITFILAIFSISIFYLLKMQQNDKVTLHQNLNYKSIKSSYENISQKYKRYYRESVLYDLSSLELKRAIIEENKEALYKLSIDKYRTLQRNNDDLIMMNFHLPNNTILLNMDRPQDIYRDKVSFLVNRVHKNHKSLFGFEQEEKSIVYKGVYPIFYDKEYIGAVELGVDINYILKDMKKYANIDGVLFSKHKNDTVFNLVNNTTDDISIVDLIKNSDISNDKEMARTRRGQLFSIYTFKINNRQNLPIAKLHFIDNIEDEIGGFEEDLESFLIYLAGMIFITLIVVNFTLKRSMKELQNSFDILDEYADMVDNNIMIVDVSKDFTITGVSQLFCDVSGYTKDELIGKHFDALKDPSASQELYEIMHEELEKNGKWSGDLQNRTKDGQKYWLSTKIEAKFRDGELICYDYIMHNITARKINEEIVYIDELTSLYNKKHFNDVFPRMVNGIKRNGGCVNFIVLDIDDFSDYNEVYGHGKGDDALISIADKLNKSLRRPDDYCFRLSGAEFGILFRSASEDEGLLFTQVLKKNVEMLGIKHEGNITYGVLTASCGLVSLESHKIDTYQDIQKRAYEHLSRAKADGRNKVISKMF